MKWKFLLIIFLGFRPLLKAQQGLIVSKAMVVSAREEASQIGVDIIKKGSNGFNTMMASELALRDKNYQNFAALQLASKINKVN
jgi:gamma-glutamyltranspeptidase/glutathione hydrolase